MRNCTKSVSSSLFSDRPPSREWLSNDAYLTLMWTLWKLMSARSLLIIWGVEFIDGPPGVKGRLKQCVSYWESTISASRFVLDVISEGYKLPFSRVPAPCFRRNNRSAELHPSFVEKDISKLLVEACHWPPAPYPLPLLAPYPWPFSGYGFFFTFKVLPFVLSSVLRSY